MKKLNLWIDHWGESKFFALYNENDLVCVTVYKRGAVHVKKILEKMESQLDELAGITEDSGIEGRVEGGFNYDRWANGGRRMR